MTTTSRRVSLLAFAAFQVIVYVGAWWVVLTAGHVSFLPVAAGFLIPVVLVALLNRWRAFAAWVAICFALLFVPDDFGDDFFVGLCCFAIVTLTVAAAVKLGTIRRDAHLAASDTPAAPAPRLLAISGYAGSGKDEAAKGLLAAGWHRVAFADRLRELALVIDPIVGVTNDERLSELVSRVGWNDAKKTPEVRRLLQVIGGGVRDVLGEDTWVDAALADLPAGDVVITDARYVNEAEAVRAAGGRVIRITRPGVAPVNPHESETALDAYDFDGHLVNDGDLTTLHARVRALVEDLPAVT